MCARSNQPDPSRPDPDSGLIDAAFEQAASLSSSAASSRRLSGTALPPDSFTGYKIVQEIQRGGQGVVYEAIQESTRRNVAIKVMNEGPMAGARGKARFEQEIHLLSQLRHPNIVTIHDSGSSADGFYFVMDYIRGEPLDAYVSAKKLSIRETLVLFATVCEAVNVAHLRGVIHRDLKPSNIRIDPAGQPHILDFGLAKVSEFDALADSRSEMRTMTGQFVGSLPWASPEQVEARHGGVDIRSDVYSLGVMLFQILTGRFPYEVVGNIRDVLENICSVEPPRVSSLRRETGDEVDAIVLRCLRKDKELRYQSAGELARDIRRYLAGDPIEAKRDSGWYVFRKMLRRYRVQAVVAGIVFLFTVASIIALAVWYERERELRADAEAAQTEAERQEAVARAVVDFLTKDVLQAVRPYKHEREPTAREMFDQAVAKIDEDGLTGEPLVEAEIRHTVGVSYRWLGKPVEAVSELQKALAVFRAELGEEHEKSLQAMYQLGAALTDGGKLDEAEALLNRAVELQDRVLGPDHEATLNSRNELAGLLRKRGKLDDATALLRKVLDARLRVQGPEDRDTLTAMGNLATALSKQNRLDEAEALLQQAYDTFLETSGPEHSDTLVIGMGLAEVLRKRGNLDEAEPLARRVLAGLRETLGAGHDHTLQSMLILADVLEQKKELEEVERILREALKLQRESGFENPTRISIAIRLAFLLRMQGNLKETETLFKEALELQRRFRGDDNADTFMFMCQLGSVLLDSNKHGEAEDVFREALEISRRAFDEEDPKRAAAVNNLAVLLLNEKPEEAEPLLREALELHRKSGKDDPVSLIYNLASALHGQDKFDEAESLYRETLERQRNLENESPATARLIDALACLLKDQQRLDEAEPFHKEALEMAERIWPEGHFLTENYRSHWGECLTAMQRYSEAEAQLLLSHERLQELLPEGHHFRINRIRALAELYEAWGKSDEAAAWRARLPESADDDHINESSNQD